MSGFVRDIRQNTVDSQQSSPAYVITMLRWSNRDVFNYPNFADSTDVRNPFVITNDAIQVVTTNDKRSLTPTASIILKGGEFNYATAVHPGDFVLINMLNWEEDAVRVAAKASLSQPINEIADGFQGVYKVQSVVKDVSVNANGIKQVFYTVTAAGFTEFNNSMYYNPAIAAEFRDKGKLLWSQAIGEFYQDLLKSNSQVQTILKALFKILIGKSYRDTDNKVRNFSNSKFILPKKLGSLLGRTRANFATELYNYVIGVWVDSTQTAPNDSNLGPSMNPSIVQEQEENFFRTPIPLQGNKEVFLENWNQKTAWSILKSYTNEALNEMYTTYRLDSNNRVQPTVIVRQKPFTTPHFKPPQPKSQFPVTNFLTLPRWRVSVNLLKRMQTSKNDAARFNFVQVYTRRLASTVEQDMAAQIAEGNFVSDDSDIERNGLRTYVVTSNFDFPDADRGKDIRARQWSKIISDWIIDGHLKESGTLTFYGIQDPISVGDNIELDNIIYHIESISNSIMVSPEGKKKFETKLTVSYGMDKRSSKAGPVYANMEHISSDSANKEDYEHERILPGLSDSQDTPGRAEGETVKETVFESFTPVNLRKPRKKTAESNTGEDLNHSELSGKSRKKD